jgi:hypothetical protein
MLIHTNLPANSNVILHARAHTPATTDIPFGAASSVRWSHGTPDPGNPYPPGGPENFGPTMAQYFPFKLLLQYTIIIIHLRTLFPL